MDSLHKIAQINEQNALKAADEKRHFELVDSALQTQQVILRSFSSLVDFLADHVTKAEVINQLEQIGTPDAYVVADAVNNLHETLRGQEPVDLSEITGLMREVLAQAQQIPKELPELVVPEQETIDYSEQLKNLEDAVKAVTDAVKAQKTTVEAPVVNVPETRVNVDAPDLKPLSKDIKAVEKAVKTLVFPEYKTDNAEVEKLLKKQNRTLEQILDKPVGGGGGGGGIRSTAFEDANSAPYFIKVNPDGSLPTNPILKKIVDNVTTTGITYVGEAAVGTATSSAGWRIQKIDETGSITYITWSGVGFNVKWDERATVVAYS